MQPHGARGRAARRECLAVHVHGVGTRSRFATASARSRASGRPPSRTCWSSARPTAHSSDLRDLCRRLDLNKVNRRVLEALIRSGACDSMGSMRNRATLMHQLPAAMQAADQSTRAREAGQTDLFGSRRTGQRAVPAPPIPATDAAQAHETLPEWSEAVRLAGERETLGLYLTGHPIAEYERELKPIISGRIADVGGAKPVVQRRRPRRRARRQYMARPGSQRHGRRSRARSAQARRPHELHSRRPQWPPRGDDVRGRLPAVPHARRQGCDPGRGRWPALGRLHRRLAPGGEEDHGRRPGPRAVRAQPGAAVASEAGRAAAVANGENNGGQSRWQQHHAARTRPAGTTCASS